MLEENIKEVLSQTITDKMQAATKKTEEELMPCYSGRKGYYHKAYVIKTNNGLTLLRSYTTIVACAIKLNGKLYGVINAKYSPTTTVHQRDFLAQFADKNIPASDLTNYQVDFPDYLVC